MEIKLVDRWDDVMGNHYLTLDIGDNERVDVKKYLDGSLYYTYFMDCNNGLEVYKEGEDDGHRDLSEDERKELMNYIREQFEVEEEMDKNFLTGFEKERKERDMENRAEQLREISAAVKELRNAWHRCHDIFTDYDGDINDIVVDEYPFQKSFDEYYSDVEAWALSVVHKVRDELNKEKVVYETNYSGPYDRIFIMKCTYKGENIISEECVGFYAGEPDEDATKQFTGKLKAEYSWD